MKYKKLISFLAFFLAVLSVYGQNPFILKSGEPVTIACGNSEEEVVHTALNLLNRDVESVFSTRIIVTPESKKGMIIVGTIGQSDLIDKAGVDLSPIKNKKEAFLLAVSSTGKLVIAGSDKRGTAYGVMELSRLIGVSPWEWWADATPAKKEIFQLPASYRNMQSPSVEYRGIFINDEDWGLTPWSWQTYEPSDVKGQIGPKTHERIFELLLRLRANTFWPAMHGCSVPFYFTPGNKEVADKFGIFIGTSHCEPMMRNTNGEWKRDGVGEYDYVHNSAHVLSFWEQRVKEVAGLDNLYTLGMRGVHDGAMNGAKTIEEQKAVLTKVLRDQRDLLTKYVNKDVTQVPQVFIPYKEVLDVYHAGLQVPDEVTLMWCDDNYGYIRHFPTAEERARKGGNGVYYHVSYWGRPHDYLWLGTAHPSLVYQQMSFLSPAQLISGPGAAEAVSPAANAASSLAQHSLVRALAEEIVEAALRRSGEWAGLDAAETGNAPDGAYRYALYEAHGAARVPYAYGILGQQRLDGEWKTVAMIAPFSNDSAATAHLARLCTGQQLEPIHILDVIHDFMNTEARTL